MNERQLTKAFKQFKAALKASALEDCARKTGFTRRSRKVRPQELAVSLITAMATQSTKSIADLLRKFGALTGQTIAYKPFHNQLAKPEFPSFMRAVVQQLLKKLLVRVLEHAESKDLENFDDIVIQDGTSFAVPDQLKQIFPGRFSKKSPAAVELHTTMSLFSDEVVRLSITADARAERPYLPAPKTLERKLILADRGYQDVDYCEAVDLAQGYMIFRFQLQTNPRVLRSFVDGKDIRQHRGQRLHDFLRKAKGRTVDVDGEWNRSRDRRVCLRVVLLWHKKIRRYILFVTNLDRTQYPPQRIFELYRLRWQVELLFREWKSHSNLHAFGTRNASMTEGLIWSSIAASILKRYFAHSAQILDPTIPISTLRTSNSLCHHLEAISAAVIKSTSCRQLFASALSHLMSLARRAHPNRDRRKGRMRMGFRFVDRLETTTPLVF